MTPESREPSVLDQMLEQEARQLLEARMLPNEGPLTAAQREEVRTALEQYMQKHVISQKEVAKQCAGVGVSNLNAILNGKYTHGPIDDHLREINNWMEVDARRRQTRPQRPFVETHVAKKILRAAEKASEKAQIVIAFGPTGIGKSMVAHVVAERFPAAIYIRISEGNNSFTALRRMLAERLRFYVRRKRKSDPTGLTVNERIFDKLRGSNRLLIIDEAHRIGDSALQFVRDLYDECEIPILLLATKDLVDRVRRDSDEDHGQLYSRIGWTCDLVRGKDKTPGGKSPLFTVAEIRKIFESDKVKLHPDAQGYLQDVANMLGQGSLRSCERILRWAVQIERHVRNLSHTDGVTINAPCLRKAESESKDDRGMLDDMEVRSRTAAAATA